MGYIICAIAFFILGRKYQELTDLMMARRISKMVVQREKIAKEKEEYEKWIEQDKRIGEMMTRKGKEKNDNRSIYRTSGTRENLSYDPDGIEEDEERERGIC